MNSLTRNKYSGGLFFAVTLVLIVILFKPTLLSFSMGVAQFMSSDGCPADIRLADVYRSTEEQRGNIFLYANRRAHLINACGHVTGGDGEKTRSMLSANLPRVIVDTEHKLTICLVAKVATSTTKTMLLQASSHPNASLVDQTRYDQLSDVGLKSVNELDEDEAVRALASREYTRIITVRHPIERLMSAYRDKMFKAEAYVKLRLFILRRFPDLSNKSEHPTFKQFVRFVTASAAQLSGLSRFFIENKHWEPQSSLCQPCLLSYDYILKYETLQKDSEVILRLLYPDGEESLPIVNSSPKSNATTGPEPWLNLPGHLKQLLVQKYLVDFKLFGYCESQLYGNLC